jgi:uncharacterized protein
MREKYMKFIADAMLGRLARWLRFLGFDTLYYPDIEDSRLIKIALEEDRCILTRDTRLVQIGAVKDYLLLLSNSTFQQLVEANDALHLDRVHLPGRCVACNGLLMTVTDKDQVRNSVPEYVFLSLDVFSRCADCGRVYWKGSHSRQFGEMLGKIKHLKDKHLT